MNKAQAITNLEQARKNLYKAEGDYLKSNGWVLIDKHKECPAWADPIIDSSYCSLSLALKRQLAREV